MCLPFQSGMSSGLLHLASFGVGLPEHGQPVRVPRVSPGRTRSGGTHYRVGPQALPRLGNVYLLFVWELSRVVRATPGDSGAPREPGVRALCPCHPYCCFLTKPEARAAEVYAAEVVPLPP